jgi:hypothetical protein
MRNQYKLLAEKYNLIKESFNHYWGRIGSNSKRQMVKGCTRNNIPLDFINTLESDLGEQFGEYVKTNNLLSFEDRQLKYLDIVWDLEKLYDFTSFKMEENIKQELRQRYKGKEPTEAELMHELMHDNFYDNSSRTMVFLYNHYQKWYKEVEQPRLDALNKDNPGIEMDI